MTQFFSNSDNLGMRFKQIREEAGDTQAALGKVIDVKVSGISKIEAGRQTLTAEQLSKFMMHYNVEPNDLWGFNEEKQKNNEEMKAHRLPLRELFLKVKDGYLEEKDQGEFSGSKIGKVLRAELPEALIQQASINEDKYLVTGSIGIGNFSEIPWVCLFNRGITETARNGIYLVYLFSADLKRVYLTLNQGWSFYQENFGTKQGRENIKYVAAELREKLATSLQGLEPSISLSGQGTLARGYEAGCVAAKVYNLDNMPEDRYLVNDLREFMGIYEQVPVLLEGRTVAQLIDELLKKKNGLYSEETVEEEAAYQEQVQEIVIKEEIDEEAEKKKSKGTPYVEKGGKQYWARNARLAAKALRKANFRCEYDPNHESFTSLKTGEQYQEIHHLVPLHYQHEFDYSLDVSSNLVSLCSRCHNSVHYAVEEERELILGKLFNERVELLSEAGINLTKAELFNMYKKKSTPETEK